MSDLPLRKAYPDTRPIRRMLCYGGPQDGSFVQAVNPPDGYTDFGGALVVWHALNHALLWGSK